MRRTLLAAAIGAAALAGAIALTPATAASPDTTIYQAQVALNKQGFAAGTPDGQLGRQTRRAVESFQYSNGMQATGQLTDDVLDKLGVAHAESGTKTGAAPAQPAASAAPAASPAKSAATVIYQAQLALNKQGFDAGTPDGQLGRQTQRAIQSFQYANKMEATGQLTDGVLDKLGVEHAGVQLSANAAPGAAPARAAPRRTVQCADFLHQGRPGGSDYHGRPVPGCR
jgi:peptidoglycan hydrolase-like protein with peptidoglycan-binding domain